MSLNLPFGRPPPGSRPPPSSSPIDTDGHQGQMAREQDEQSASSSTSIHSPNPNEPTIEELRKQYAERVCRDLLARGMPDHLAEQMAANVMSGQMDNQVKTDIGGKSAVAASTTPSEPISLDTGIYETLV